MQSIVSILPYNDAAGIYVINHAELLSGRTAARSNVNNVVNM